MAAFFVTGTDTGVGKTLITAGLLRAASAQGRRVAAIKPLAAGSEWRDGGRVNVDAVLLQAASTITLEYRDVNPVLLDRAMAPHLAARIEGVTLSAAALVGHCRRLQAHPADLLLAEGAGGWLVPLNDRESMADVAAMLGWPVVLVVGMKLGCLNHALLSAAAIERAGLRLAGWVANSAWPEMTAIEANIATLAARLPGPCLGRVPWLSPSAGPDEVACHLDPRPLLS
jgi:dethiobiotin synthetase